MGYGIPAPYFLVFLGLVTGAIAVTGWRVSELIRSLLLKIESLEAENTELKCQREILIDSRKKTLAQRLKAVNPDAE